MSSIKVCPHCNTMYDRRNKINGEMCCPTCYEPIKFDQHSKYCPVCEGEFKRFSKTIKFQVKDIDNRDCVIKGGYCPMCMAELVYRQSNGETTVITLDERLTADHLIQYLNKAKRERAGSNLEDLNEATSADRMWAYRLIEWALESDNVKSNAVTLGRSVYEFIEGVIRYVLKMDWWGQHLDSLGMLWNKKADFSDKYFMYKQTKISAMMDGDAQDLSYHARLEQLLQEY